MLRNRKLLSSVAGDTGTALTILENADRSAFPFQLLLIDADIPGTDGFMLVEHLQKLRLSPPAVIMMLTSTGLHSSVARCREVGISSYVEKPVRESELLQSILGIWEKPRACKTPSPVLPRASHCLRILLAEDSPVNRQFAFEVLVKLGHRVELAFNGRQAVAAVQSNQFDVILMDVQMPEMDGLEATAEIRRQEQKTGAHVPIIALTAHALSGDRQRCLAAGMDGYLQKPFYPADLHNALSPYCTRLGEAVAASSPDSKEKAVEGAQNEVLNTAEALARAGGSRRVLCRVLQVFLENLPAMWTEIQTSVVSMDAAAIRRSAHTLKGSASVIGATEATAAARELEMMAKSGRLDGVGMALDHLDRELKRLKPAVVDLRNQSA
jgi:CheY-like chemotaxis protein